MSDKPEYKCPPDHNHEDELPLEERRKLIVKQVAEDITRDETELAYLLNRMYEKGFSHCSNEIATGSRYLKVEYDEDYNETYVLDTDN